DGEGAAEAESVLCDLIWDAGETDRMTQHLARAEQLVAGLPTSRAKAHVIARASRFAMLASRDDEAERLSREALVMAEELGLDELRAAALVNLGSADMERASGHAVTVLKQAIAVADEAGASFEAARARGNLAAHLWTHGDLAEARPLWVEAEGVSRGFGQTFFTRWFHGILGTKAFTVGDWDD